MTGETGRAESGRKPYVCPRCGAERLHRSHPRTLIESVGRAVLGLHIYRCHACELRVRTFARPERAGGDHLPGSARRIERRDVAAARLQRVRIVLMVVLAAVIGSAVALYFVVE
jgi:predicted RNA-binding Zn-ribbon protein involved in translation (DUF1610 family)